ncbi:YbjQ family protein, partial [Tessaracoccus lubricantis]
GPRPRPVAPHPTPVPVPPEPISPVAQRDTDPRRPRFVTYDLPVSTTDDVPGREVAAVLGVVIGIATRPRDMAHSPEMAFINTAARQDAIGALVQQAQEAGADAVVGVRFDGGKISDTVTELAAYGTAVRLRPLEGSGPPYGDSVG